jgi:hypothetical protein
MAVAAMLVSVATMAGVPAAYADDDDGGSGGRRGDNIVEVQNTRDNSLRARSRVVVTESRGGTVDNQNVAYATGTCLNCRTAAAAIQVLIVEGTYDPATFQPANVAVAVNDRCSSCATFAFARQVVFVVGRDVRIGDRAERRIEDIEEDVDRVTRSRLPLPTMEAELDGLTEKLVEIVRAEIARTGHSGGGEDDRRQVDERGDD